MKLSLFVLLSMVALLALFAMRVDRPANAATVLGDVDCDGDVDSVDSLKELRWVAGLSVSQTGDCPKIGSEVASLFGDVDCDDDVDSVDSLKILRFVAGLPVSQTEPCPDIGLPPGIGVVSVIGQWGGEELATFESVVAPWEADTGSEMNFLGTQDIVSVLTFNVESGNPPDVAIPSEIGLMQEFARAGALVPLSACGLEDEVKANFPQGFIDLGTVDGTLYGFWFKVDGKATIWYDPKFFDDNGHELLTADSTFENLLALSQEIEDDGVVAPWSIGVESGADSGWPASDWVQAILLNNVTDGVAANDGLLDGTVPWTDPRVKEAFEKFGKIALEEGWVVQGGGDEINATNFLAAIFPPFADPPTAALHHQASFAAGAIAKQFPSAVAGEDFDFFPWPGGAVIGSGDIVYAFNDDEATCSFMRYLASAAAQQIWVEAGGAISANTQVDLAAYPDAVASKAAERLTTAETVRFDLDDALGGAIQQAIWAGLVDYLANPADLDSILAGIEAASE